MDEGARSRTRPALLAAIVAAALVAQATPARTQVQDFLPERRGVAPTLPDRAPVAPPAAAPVLPRAAPAQPAPAPSAGGPRFVLRGLRIEGSTVLGAREAEEIAAPHLDRAIGFDEVEAMRRAATLRYIERGFVNSGVVLPNQTIADGVLTLQAVEGRVAAIEVTGTRRWRPEWIRALLAEGLGQPFDIGALERRQQVILRDPFLERLNLAVEPGVVPGEAVLRADVVEAFPFRLILGFSNAQPISTGALRGSVQGVAASLLGNGDVLALQLGRTDGVDDIGLSWSVPIAPDDTRLLLRFDHNRSGVVDPALRALDIGSRYDAIGVGLSRPFLRGPEGQLTLGAAIDWRRSRTTLLGGPFSFVPGADAGETTVAALRLWQDWLRQTARDVLALRSTLSIGLDALDSTMVGTPNSRFVSWLGQGQYVRRLPNDWELLLRGSLQLSADPLFPLEQFPLGGLATVRGYRENALVSDNAAAMTAELRIPLATLPVPFGDQGPGAGLLQLVPFVDAGRGWNTRRADPQRRGLLSAGAGLRWRPNASSVAEIYWGVPLRNKGRGNTLQEQGVHFRIVLGVF